VPRAAIRWYYTCAPKAFLVDEAGVSTPRMAAVAPQATGRCANATYPSLLAARSAA